MSSESFGLRRKWAVFMRLASFCFWIISQWSPSADCPLRSRAERRKTQPNRKLWRTLLLYLNSIYMLRRLAFMAFFLPFLKIGKMCLRQETTKGRRWRSTPSSYDKSFIFVRIVIDGSMNFGWFVLFFHLCSPTHAHILATFTRRSPLDFSS